MRKLMICGRDSACLMGGTCCKDRWTADSKMGWPLTVAATGLAAAPEAVGAGAGVAVFWGACAKPGKQERVKPSTAQPERCMIRMKMAPRQEDRMWPSRRVTRGAVTERRRRFGGGGL